MPKHAPSPSDKVLTCAFCSGTGKDPFGLLSDLSRCEICQGSGKIAIHVPYVRCGECNGTGAQPHKRLTCSACGGRGVQSVAEHNQACPDCKGTGVDPDSEVDLSCSTCTGSGRVTLKT
jgi:DnaJ-class molecular chaperone